MIVHHRNLLTKDGFLLQTFIQSLTKQVESLRSTVSKNALLGFKDMIESLKKRMDNDLDSLFSATMKKATDTNIFLSKAATDVLISMCNNCNEVKVMNALSSLASKKAAIVKIKILICLDALVKNLSDKIIDFKENILFMKYVTSYLADASEKVRNNAKTLLFQMQKELGQKDFERLIRNTCNDQQERKINQIFR